ncbi:hypothetical protein N825_35455 [Skermanella stibiiresistens SB22]|uniref:Uncharacterized protein n=1 Tax=Skermanella stibiiresistens SB22 TaxID=1385369 RepID=W9H3R9_9PROT|nr:hypothetical protein [Skermanella stibiiresistens]EWY40679.1 hypothetical protein N825_35455 [Skermanella stibiiresistens SB22]
MSAPSPTILCLTAILAVILASPAAAAAKPEPRSFVAPPGRDDDRPRPERAPRIGVEQRLLPPPGAPDTSLLPADSVFGMACSAGEAAAILPSAKSRSVVRCPDPFIVIAEQP